MKILCVCQRGNNRSAGLAYLLKDKHNEDAVAIGWQSAGVELKNLLFAWADKIVVMEQCMTEHVGPTFQAKVMVCEVGPDRYGSPQHHELLDLCAAFIAKSLYPLFSK